MFKKTVIIFCLFSMIFGCTELMISASKTNFDVEADGVVNWSLNPQNSNQKQTKLSPGKKNVVEPNRLSNGMHDHAQHSVRLCATTSPTKL